jgi:hypothetical protein
MSNFQVVILQSGGESLPTNEEGATDFGVQQHSRGGDRVLNDIESLGEVWDKVVQKLSELAEKANAASGQYELNDIEFNIGIEAGLSIGLVTKGTASVVVKFTKIKP